MPKREFPLETEVEAYREPEYDKSSSQKRQKLHVGELSNTSGEGAQIDESMGSIRKLDPSIPQEAQRMKTRFKMISKGKNTVGYDEYLKQVPKSRRRKIPEHPVTPDHTLDIPNRRWQGQVKAWRISLHKYDPKDLSSVLHMEQSITDANKFNHGLGGSTTTQDEQVSLDTLQSLRLGEVSTDRSKPFSRTNNFVQEKCDRDEDFEEIEEWERNQDPPNYLDDSDDDLL
mmetsp:Transcript_12309/g.23068  ORF Transcript_12309/g.23068 Transcript_12309/m.23068 type:complete len:229 (+) Transcript_12309:235-921(+)|eukprot:CAMPEP_0176487472 /NCGR_PEP_ID=MMETSP0200_2-20121128/6152_1 /TAXON_ID=947934 /ORGANISM="Chaetoceros sp., Strain GSL56" /LENGTH=228 /DNA_ID=CAMNT_0017884307 /DNA_START=142 /DNA_END=828 /DNA_ORIENTATION=-